MSAAEKVSRGQSLALKAALVVLAVAALVAHLLSLPGLRTAVVLEPLCEGNLSDGALVAPASLEAVRVYCGRLCPPPAMHHGGGTSPPAVSSLATGGLRRRQAV